MRVVITAFHYVSMVMIWLGKSTGMTFRVDSTASKLVLYLELISLSMRTRSTDTDIRYSVESTERQ